MNNLFQKAVFNENVILNLEREMKGGGITFRLLVLYHNIHARNFPPLMSKDKMIYQPPSILPLLNYEPILYSHSAVHFFFFMSNLKPITRQR